MEDAKVKKLAEQAEKLVSRIADASYRASAFGVVFAYLMRDSDLPRTDPHSHAKPPAKARQRRRKAGPMDMLRELSDQAFFKTGKGLGEILDELRNRGKGYDPGTIGKGLQRLCQDKVLRRTKGKDSRGKAGFVYTNW